MTRPFREYARCQCGLRVPLESPMSAWIRANPSLASNKGFAVTDLDLALHRFLTYEDGLGLRDVQHLQFVEVKTRGADLPESQRDTLYVIDQLVRTVGWKHQRGAHGRWRGDHPQTTRRVRSHINGPVWLNCYGVHVLRMDGEDPDSSAGMTWSSVAPSSAPQAISATALLAVLRFDLHPDSLRPMDKRRHKRGNLDRLLPGLTLRDGGAEA